MFAYMHGASAADGSNKKQAGRGKQVQMKMDFGQKCFGSIQCKKCGMMYLPNVKEDVSQHEKYHKSLFSCSFKISRWKKDEVVEEFFDGSRILALPMDEFLAQRRLAGLRLAMETELGSDLARPAATRRAFLYVGASHEVAGCCVAEQVERAQRVLVDKENAPAAQPRCLAVGEEEEEARCGVCLIWVAPGQRGRGVATALLDSVRRHLIYGLPVAVGQVAFTDPTPAGRDFAEKYCGRPDFLVYRSRTGAE